MLGSVGCVDIDEQLTTCLINNQKDLKMKLIRLKRKWIIFYQLRNYKAL